jgi:hypothetical protein
MRRERATNPCLVGAMCLAAAVQGAFVADARAALAVSHFDSDSEGWTASGDDQTYYWSETVGNPPGAFRVDDLAVNDTWYFKAPETFLGDKATAYGGTLSWDINISSRDTSDWVAPHVIVHSTVGTVTWSDPRRPTPGQWDTYEIVLSESHGWTWQNGSSLTEEEFRAVLAAVTALEIRGEYRTGDDYGYLDNVILTPEPGTVVLLSLGTAVLARKRRA